MNFGVGLCGAIYSWRIGKLADGEMIALRILSAHCMLDLVDEAGDAIDDEATVGNSINLTAR